MSRTESLILLTHGHETNIGWSDDYGRVEFTIPKWTIGPY